MHHPPCGAPRQHRSGQGRRTVAAHHQPHSPAAELLGPTRDEPLPRIGLRCSVEFTEFAMHCTDTIDHHHPLPCGAVAACGALEQADESFAFV